jgi:methylated-DNA-[protein]-cysteine S-methyltransferase
MFEVSQFDSPLGKIVVAERKTKVFAICFGGRKILRETHPELWEMDEVKDTSEAPSARSISAYLNGRVGTLRVPIDMALVSSEFDRLVLGRLFKVRPGQTVSYGELAAVVGRPGAARAVGGAMRRNPIPIVLPCHRVLPASGRLGNYTGGVNKKSWLLAREGIRL